MTQNEIIEMAREAGNFKSHALPEPWIPFFVAFAKLVADKKHEELYRLAEDAPVRGDARETRQNILHAISARGNQC
jgi:hypothetical protein